jgi:molybdenum-dependent DNA-binding transcriptional regulator ModE
MMRQLFYITGISRTTIAHALGVSYKTVWTHTKTRNPRSQAPAPREPR